MSSGKTDELLRLLRRAEIAKRRILLVRPGVDDRTPGEYAESRSKARYPSVLVPKGEPVGILSLARERDVDLVGIEEAQFFDSSLTGVVETLRQSGRQHALVTDPDGCIRGIFSATQIARQLGVDPQSVNPAEIAQTFAEIETLLAR